MRTNSKGIIHLVIPIVIVIFGIIGIVVYSVVNKNELLNSDTIEESFQNQTSTPSPIPKGTIEGKLTGGYYLRPAVNTKVLFTPEISTTTNDKGEFSITDIPVGKYSLTFESPEYMFASFDVDIKEGNNKLDKEIWGNLKNPKPTTVSISCFIDANKNSSKDTDDRGLDAVGGVYFFENNTWVSVKNFQCDSKGQFSENISKIGKYRIDPGSYTFYGKPGVKELIVDGYGGVKNFNLNYIPMRVQSGFTVYVFNDKNENSSKDDGEEYVHYQNVKVTNQSGVVSEAIGSTFSSGVGVDGFTHNQFEPGNYYFELVPQDGSWGSYFKITKSQHSVTFSQNTSHQTIYLGAHKLY